MEAAPPPESAPDEESGGCGCASAGSAGGAWAALGLLADADIPNLHVEKTMLGAAEKVVELAGTT